MIKRGNFSGDPIATFKAGKEAFVKTYKGLYNGDLESLWAEIEKLAEGEVKPPQNKVEKPTKTK